MASANTADGEELDIKELQGKQDKIRDLMRRDPRFIGRLIVVSTTAVPAQQQLLAQHACMMVLAHALFCL
jgi:hypothetical protein